MVLKTSPESVTEKPQSTGVMTTSNGSSSALSDKAGKIKVSCNCVSEHSESGSSISPDSSLTLERKCCLKQRLSSVFEDEHLSDVLFIVGQGNKKERIPAHKVLLSVGSSVFKAMFSKPWSADSSEVEVTDVEPFAFSAMLRFLYTDDAGLTSDNVMPVLYAARKYAVLQLESHCVEFLVTNLCPENAFAVLKEGRFLDIQRLVNSCLEKIDEDTATAIASDAFCAIDIDTLCLILGRNTLTVKEIELFEAVLRWSEAECLRQNRAVSQENQQSVLEKALPLVRFPLMTVVEFASKVAPSGLLTKDVLLSVYQHLATKPRPSTNFCETPRLSDRELIVNRFETCVPGYVCTGLENSLDFTCDRDLELLGYGLHGPLSGAGKYEVKIQLWDTLTDANLRDETADFFCDDASMTFRAFFKCPITITALKKYTACLCLNKGPDCFVGKGGMKEVTVDLLHNQEVTISFSNYLDDADVLTNVDEGLIPQLIFKI